MRRALAAATLSAALVGAPVASAAAQGPAPVRFERWAPEAPVLTPRADPMSWLLGDSTEDHRYPGFYIGAATGFLLGVAALGFCADSDSSDGCSPFAYVLVPVASVAFLGMVGALVGGMIPKSRPAPAGT